jgi:hypothetical protein
MVVFFHKKMSQKRFRNWCFTFNNYTPEQFESIKGIASKYLIVGKETAPETGTPHLQGYICFKNAKTLTAIKALFPDETVHLEPAKGNSLQNYEYCTKGGDYFEAGERPATNEEKGSKSKEIWAQHWHEAIEGNFLQLPPAQIKTWEYINAKFGNKPQDLNVLRNFWVHGPSGCGKSSTIRKVFGNVYYTKNPSKWWDGYQNQEIVLLDDLDPHHFMIGYYLKIWCDHYIFTAEVKGGMLSIRPKILIVTSQYTIDQVFNEPNSDQQTRDALNRRFQVLPYSEGIVDILTAAKEQIEPEQELESVLPTTEPKPCSSFDIGKRIRIEETELDNVECDEIEDSDFDSQKTIEVCHFCPEPYEIRLKKCK